MKTKQNIQLFFLFLILIILSSAVFAIQGTSSDGSVTAKNGGVSAAAASGASSENVVTGRVSAGGSGVSSSYSGTEVSGSPGPDLSTADEAAAAEQKETTKEESSSTIPSGGDGGGESGGSADSGAGESTDAETTTEATETTAEAAQTTDQAAEVAETAAEPVTIAVELSEGSSLTLSPETGAAEMTVIEVTETTATIVIESAQTAEDGNSIIGAVVIGVEQETTLNVGETVEVDSDGDGEIDLEITLSKIVYDEETGKYRGIFTTTYLYPNEEIIAFIEEQVASGEVALVERPSMERMAFGYWIWLIVAVLVICVVGFILWVLKDKKTKKYTATTIPTHYFEKILRNELGQRSEQREHSKKEDGEEKKVISKARNSKKKTKRTKAKKRNKKLKKKKGKRSKKK
jgi:hypothetical protein